MAKTLYQVKIGEQMRSYPEGTPYRTIADEFQKDFDHDIMLVLANGRLQELFKHLKHDCELEFVTTADRIGHRTYERSMTFLMVKAVYDICPKHTIRTVHIMYSLSKGLYAEVEGDVSVDQDFLARLDARMRELIREDKPIMKSAVNTQDARRFFHQVGTYDKEKLFRYRQASKVNLYDLDGFKDYYYGYMAVSTGVLKYFALYPYDAGFVLQLPTAAEPEKIPPFEPQHKLFQVMKQSEEWSKLLDIRTIGDLNDQIIAGNAADLVLVQEALQEKKIGDIADRLVAEPEKKFILIAGPSSSGKTSFANRLSIQLRAHGLRPHPISVDNYFVNREKTPKDEQGNYDFESIHALDLELLNHDLNSLLAGEVVDMPTYNFTNGRQEFQGDQMQMGENDVLVIEGIHCLNDELTYQLDPKNKFKIYISALTTLNVDEHNRIPTTDGRLLRRIARDARTRGITAQQTIRMWPSVRRGEERNIFPYQEQADCMFNSALIYELAVLKQYCEPLLYGIPRTEPEYMEAKRLLKFLDYVLGFGSDNLPNNSLVREFVGGSCFRV